MILLPRYYYNSKKHQDRVNFKNNLYYRLFSFNIDTGNTPFVFAKSFYTRFTYEDNS